MSVPDLFARLPLKTLAVVVSLALPQVTQAREAAIDELRQTRAAAGLGAPIDADRKAQELAWEIAGHAANRRPVERPDFEIGDGVLLDCRCDLPSRDGEERDASTEWAAAHGLPDPYGEAHGDQAPYRGPRATFVAIGSSGIAAARQGIPGVDAVLLDPRMTAATVVARDGFAVLAAVIDTGRPWGAPVMPVRERVRPAPGRADPSSRRASTGPHVVVPDEARVRASIFTAERWQRMGSLEWSGLGAATVRADTGALAVVVDEGTLGEVLAYDARYRLAIGEAHTEFSTAAAPAALLRGRFRFRKSMNARLRKVVKDAVASANPRARRLIAQVDGLVTIEAAGGGGLSFAGDMQIIYQRGHLLAPRLERRMIVLHEIGHTIDAAMVDPGTRRRVDRLVPRGGRCRPRNPLDASGACAPRAERFADTFAKWALGSKLQGINAGYRVRAPRSLAGWGRALMAGVHLRPAGPRAAALPAAAPAAGDIVG